MAVVASWSGAGLADGTAVTTSTAGTGDTAFAAFVTAGAFQVDTSGLHTPRIQADQAAATDAQLMWNTAVLGTLGPHAVRMYFELSALPGGNGRLLAAHDASNVLCWWLDVTSAGILRLRDPGGSAKDTSAAALPTGTEMRLEVVADGAGAVTATVYTGNGTTPWDTLTGTGFGTTFQQLRILNPSTSPTWPRLWVDEIAVANVAAEIGPVVSPIPSGTGSITATATLAGTGAKTASSTGTAAAASGGSGTGTKTVAGHGAITATATLTGAGATPPLTAPEVPAFLPGVPVGSLPGEFNAKIRDPLHGLLAPACFRARNTGGQTIAENTVQAVEWDTADEDPYEGWNAANPTRFVVPDGWAGWWHATANVSIFGTGAAGLILIPSIAVNSGLPNIGVIYEGQEVFIPTGTSGTPKTVNGAWWVYAKPGDIVELTLYFSSESGITAVDTTAGVECRLELIWDGA